MATNHQNAPRAVIHQQILDSAATQPDASMEEIADEVPGASTDLVERVLEEYGDPGASSSTTGYAADHEKGATHEDANQEEEPVTEHATAPTTADLTPKELETLRAIAKEPDATQGKLAERLGVTRATVNKRLNDIDGFEWGNRRRFVEAVFDDETAASIDAGQASNTFQSVTATSDGGQWSSPGDEGVLSDLQKRVTRLEQQHCQSSAEASPAIDDAEVLAKVVRAVVADESISADEELYVLTALL